MVANVAVVKKYNPQAQSVKHLIETCETRWGQPEQNRSMLLPFGIAPFDRALYGMDIRNGELILVQGPEKQRKTTMVINIICHYMQSKLPVVKPMTVIDTLESGMTPDRYLDALISVVATQVLMRNGHRHREFCPACNLPKCAMLGISPEFLMYNTRKPDQAAAIKTAMAVISEWPLQIYGAAENEGDTRNLAAAMIGSDKMQSRWAFLVEEFGAKVIACDHLQQYNVGMGADDYTIQRDVVKAASSVVAKLKVVNLMISQVSLTSQRELSQGTGKYTAAGGLKGAQEATSIFSVNYKSGSGELRITLEDSRKAGAFAVNQRIEDTSGTFYGEPMQIEKSQMRPGVEGVSNNGKH